MGAIDDFFFKYDPDPRAAFAVDPNAAALALLETTTYETVNAMPALALSTEERSQWRGQSTTQLGYILRGSAEGLTQVPALAKHIGLSADEAQRTVASDTACCGYIKVLEAVVDGAECGALRTAEQAVALVKELQAELAAISKTLPPAQQTALGTCFAASMLHFEQALSKGDDASSRQRGQAQPLQQQLSALTDQGTIKQAVRSFVNSLQQRGAQVLAGVIGGHEIAPRPKSGAKTDAAKAQKTKTNK